MYLWKCWLDTKLKFLITLGLFLCLQLAFLFSSKQTRGTVNAAQLHNGFLIVLVVISSALLFVGWILGDENAGADIGRGSGDFLLTRPCPRGSLVWTGWMVGMVETIALWILFSAIVLADLFFQARQWGFSASVLLSSWGSFHKLDLPILFLIFLINLGSIYGLTYCLGIITRSGSRALIGSAALVLGYVILKAVLLHRFHIALPELLLFYSHSDHRWEIPPVPSFVIRGAIALAFPVLAHVVLERTEI